MQVQTGVVVIMFKSRPLLCIGVLALLAGCTDEPLRAPKLFGPITFQNWMQQERATNVQDWHRMAQTIADEMQTRGLLLPAASASPRAAPLDPAQHPFFIISDQDTPFVRELNRALKTEILRRQGVLALSPVEAHAVHLGVDVVQWGSRVNADPERPRSEAVWYASLNSANGVLMTVQQPFYIFNSDVALYSQNVDSGRQLARTARPLRYEQ